MLPRQILNALCNYLSHETLTCDDKYPHGLTRIQSLLQDENKLYKDGQRSNTNTQLLNKLNHLQEQLNFLINRSKQNCYTRKTKSCTSVSKSCQVYQSLLRRLLNNKKMPLVPPLFHENKFVMDFKERAFKFSFCNSMLFNKQQQHTPVAYSIFN